MARHIFIPKALGDGNCLSLITTNKINIGDAINKEIALAGSAASLNEIKLKFNLKSMKHINDKIQIQIQKKPSTLFKK
ncbi:hypothetical protein [Aeromonas veronii]|uniref:hypothetical protein n=1 Tax=Aeromonas veronii TaxID=654 RepID=UPI003F7998D0